MSCDYYEKIKNTGGETTSPYKFTRDERKSCIYHMPVLKKRDRRKKKRKRNRHAVDSLVKFIGRALRFVENRGTNEITRDSSAKSVNEWKINITIVAVGSPKEKEKERERRRKFWHHDRSIDRGVRSRWNRRGRSPLVRDRQSYFSSAIETLDAAKKPRWRRRISRDSNPSFLETRTEDARTRIRTGGDRATTKKNIRVIHFRSSLRFTPPFFYFSSHRSKFRLRPQRSEREPKIYRFLVDHYHQNTFFFTLTLSLSLHELKNNEWIRARNVTKKRT